MRLDGKRRFAIYGAAAAIGISMLSVVGSTPASAQTVVQTFTAVPCVALVNGTPLSQTQDITIGLTVPDSVTPGEDFTVTIPGGSAGLPTRASGLNITSYSNLFQTLQINGTTFNPGTATVTPPTAGLLPSASAATLWSTSLTYASGVFVYENVGTPLAPIWKIYQSLAAGNHAHDPNLSPASWTEVDQNASSQWSATTSYALNAFTIAGGVTYKSLAASNLNNPPATTPAKWAVAGLTTPSTATITAANQIKYGQPGPFNPGNAGDALVATLTTPDVTVHAIAPASGAVTINMVTLTTQVILNGVLTAAVTCSVPNTVLVTIPVVSGTTTTSAAPTTTTVAPTTTTVAPTTTTVAPTTTTVAPTTTTTGAGTTTTTSGATTTTVAPTTTTTAGPTTTTTVPIVQVKIHGSVTNLNQCTSSLDPALQPPAPVGVKVTIATDAFPRPHKGEPIALTNGKVTVSIDPSLLQQGVDLGIITDGMKIPSTATLVIAGSSTKEGTHTFTVKSTNTVHVVAGKAQPLTAVTALPNTTWHPKDKTTPVLFTEKSLKIVSALNILGSTFTSTIACAPNGSAQVVGLAAQGTELPPTTVVLQGTTSPTTVAGAAGGPGTLPRTGINLVLLLVLIAATIDVGIVAISFARRRVVRR